MPSCSWFQMSIVGGLPNQHVTLQFGVFNDLSEGVLVTWVPVPTRLSASKHSCRVVALWEDAGWIQVPMRLDVFRQIQFDGLGMFWSSRYSYTLFIWCCVRAEPLELLAFWFSFAAMRYNVQYHCAKKRISWGQGGRLWQVKNVKSRRMLAMTLCKWAEVEKLQRWGDRMKKLDAVASYLASRPPPGPGAHGKPGSIITKYSQPSLRQSVSTSGYMYTDLNVLVWSV